MADVQLSRDFPVPPVELFVLLTARGNILQWFGHDTTIIADEHLDFSRIGPWFAVLENAEGRRFKMSGQVTHVRPPDSVGFTWAWHDDADHRGADSHVTFSLASSGDGARLTIDHRDLETPEMAASHQDGWTVAMDRLARITKPTQP